MADIITYPENGITYDADDASGYLATRLSGVYSSDDFAVSQAGGLTVTVSAGQAWVHPARFKGRSIILSQADTLTLTDADATRSRIDRVVLRYDAAARKSSLLVLEGTPDSTSPAAPDITRTALVYDLGLATITRKAGSTAVTAADITDTRTDEDVCGLMRDGVTGIPTAQLQTQFTALLDNRRQSISNVDSGSFYTKAQVDALLKGVNPFPVGSIYQTTSSTSPASLFGGTWEEIASERVLMGASSSHAAGSTVDAGLPNIAGTFTALQRYYQQGYPAETIYFAPTGAFNYTEGTHVIKQGDSSALNKNFDYTFDASRSSSVYGNSTTVQPAAYYVYIWHRIA